MERDVDEEIASLQLVINDLESEIVAMQRHFDVELRVAGDRLQNAVCIPPLDYKFAQRFADWSWFSEIFVFKTCRSPHIGLYYLGDGFTPGGLGV